LPVARRVEVTPERRDVSLAGVCLFLVFWCALRIVVGMVREQFGVESLVAVGVCALALVGALRWSRRR
jgi:hypothetical protein